MKKEIKTINEIKALVDSFYTKVREDALLGGIFQEVIQDKWPDHLQKMYRFWQTVLLKEHTYYGSPFPPHAKLPVTEAHFDRWLKLFRETVDQHFEGQKAEEAKWRAEKMAAMFHSKIKYSKGDSSKSLI